MRGKYLCLVLAIAVLFSGAYAKTKKGKKPGRLSVSANVSVFDPPGDVSSALLFEVSAKYRISQKFTGELSAGWSQYDDNGTNTTYVPVQTNLEFHPLGRGMFDPYVGGGLSANFTQANDQTTATAGVQALGGLSFKPADKVSFSVEIKYNLPDITDPKSGGFSLGGGADLNWSTEM